MSWLKGLVDTMLGRRTYTVVEGDTLSKIAQVQLGSAGRWPEIARLNCLPNQNLIKPGQVLKLPARTLS